MESRSCTCQATLRSSSRRLRPYRHCSDTCKFMLLESTMVITNVWKSFHANGRYLLSAGIDRMINLVSPSLQGGLLAISKVSSGHCRYSQKPTRAKVNHLGSTIHISLLLRYTRRLSIGMLCLPFPNYYLTHLSVMWHGDLIFSKADSEGCIALWSIDNFDSSLPTPESIDAPAIPVPLRDTRSAFSPVNSDSLGYTSHLKLDIPKATYMFTRFSIFPGSKTHNPILSFLNSASQIFFWDLTRFREYYDVIDKFPGASTNKSDSQTSSQASEFGTRKHPFLQPFQHRIHRGPGRPPLMRDSPAESTNGSNASEIYEPGGTGKVDWARGREQWKKKYDLCDAHTLVEPHHTVTVKDCTVLGRQMAWSRDGKWCVAVGSWGQMALLGRWDGRVAGT